ncbi:MAG: hypothetical protein K2N55_13485 [Lachnospiraceae bacterium]|nr:hypothetical protein [Lachnospiraceae bacterium]
MKRRLGKRLICLFVAALMVLAMGCTSITEGTNAGGESDVATGRYAEEEINLAEMVGTVSGMKKLSDGTLLITDRQMGVLKSKDNGATWESENSQWLEDKLSATYVMDIQITEDGTLGIIYDDYEARNHTEEDAAADVEGEESENSTEEDSEEAKEDVQESDSAFDLSPECALVKADGTVIPVALAVTEEEMYPNRIWMSDTGKIFVTTLGDTIYEVKEDGSSESYLTLEGRPMQISFNKDKMIVDGYGFKAPLIYDMDKKAYIEDTALNAFVEEQYGERGFNGGSWYDLAYFFDTEGTLYLAGKKGLHRHVIGEEELEQLIDGALSRLGSPQYGIKDMVMLEKEKFLAVFNSGKLVRFSFDPNMPSVPSNILKLYSLEESYDLRVAISLYQVSHPDVFVEYEIGMAQGNGVTREDALKKLNTEIMAGEGPDLLMLDKLPMDSYIDKGLLLDLSGTIEGLSEEDELFENLFWALQREDDAHTGIYAAPGQAAFPVMLGREQYVTGMKDLTSVADKVEQIRADHPGKDILGICSEKGIMKIFAVASAPAWKKDNGEIDREAVEAFLAQVKRIYDAQMDGISQKSIDTYNSSGSWYSEQLGDKWAYELSLYGLNTLDYVGDYTQFMVGMTTYPYGYYDITSAAKAKGYEDTLLVPMTGLCSNVFVPQTMLGISTSSSQKDLAEDFLKAFLGKETQYALGGLSVNKAALEELFTPKEEYLGENNLYGSMARIDEDGVEVALDVYFPDEDEIKTLKGWMESADTPYIEDTVFEETVFEEGAKYIQGNQSLEETLDAIWQQLAIYMSE